MAYPSKLWGRDLRLRALAEHSLQAIKVVCMPAGLKGNQDLQTVAQTPLRPQRFASPLNSSPVRLCYHQNSVVRGNCPRKKLVGETEPARSCSCSNFRRVSPRLPNGKRWMYKQKHV